MSGIWVDGVHYVRVGEDRYQNTQTGVVVGSEYFRNAHNIELGGYGNDNRGIRIGGSSTTITCCALRVCNAITVLLTLLGVGLLAAGVGCLATQALPLYLSIPLMVAGVIITIGTWIRCSSRTTHS